MKKIMWSLAVKFIAYMLCSTIIVVAYLIYSFIHTPMNISGREELCISRGDTIGNIARQLKARNILKSAKLLHYLAWYRGDANNIKAGEYLIETNFTPVDFLRKIVDGRVIQHNFTIISGWTFSQVLDALHKEVKLSNKLTDYTQQEIMHQLIPNGANANIEGMLWPDTYFYTAGTAEIELLRRAYNMMQVKLQQIWDGRDNNLQLKDKAEAVVLASILEKETSLQAEYYTISGVFHKRLQKNMLLQADPTVIYALNKATDFKVAMKRIDLTIDSPYNTYRYLGLPPAPIAIPSFNALHAAVHPASVDALYFVADGKGGHMFSATLTEHNKAVQEYKASRHRNVDRD